MASPPVTGPSLANTPGVNQINILNAIVPPEGPKSLALVLDFTSTGLITVDLTITTSQGKISTVQMAFIDNSENTAPLQISVDGTSYTIDVPAGCQGWFPLVATNRPKLVFSTAAGIIIDGLLLNVPVAQGYWFPNGNGASGGIDPLAFTIATGGTAQVVWAAGAVPSGGGVIKNPTAATEALLVDIVNNADTTEPGANGTTVSLAAGESFVVPPNFQGAVTVNAATTAHAFVAYGVGNL